MEKERYDTGATLLQHIESCFLELLHAKPYHRITVVDICQKAHIARKTFYCYYTSKEACMDAIIKHMVEGAMVHTFTQMAGNHDFKRYYESYLSYWKNENDFLDIVVCNHLEHLIVPQMVNFLLNSDADILQLLDTEEIRADMDIIQSYVTCEFSLILQWCARGYDDPVEVLAAKLIRIVHQPLIPASKAGRLWRLMIP